MECHWPCGPIVEPGQLEPKFVILFSLLLNMFEVSHSPMAQKQSDFTGTRGSADGREGAGASAPGAVRAGWEEGGLSEGGESSAKAWSHSGGQGTFAGLEVEPVRARVEESSGQLPVG